MADPLMSSGIFFVPEEMKYIRPIRVEGDDEFDKALLEAMLEPIPVCDDCDTGKRHQHGCFVIGSDD